MPALAPTTVGPEPVRKAPRSARRLFPFRTPRISSQIEGSTPARYNRHGDLREILGILRILAMIQSWLVCGSCLFCIPLFLLPSLPSFQANPIEKQVAACLTYQDPAMSRRNRRWSTLPSTTDVKNPPVQCIVGETIRPVRIWSEEQWNRIAPEDRPHPAEHVPGVGWVGVASGKNRPD